MPVRSRRGSITAKSRLFHWEIDVYTLGGKLITAGHDVGASKSKAEAVKSARRIYRWKGSPPDQKWVLRLTGYGAGSPGTKRVNSRRGRRGNPRMIPHHDRHRFPTPGTIPGFRGNLADALFETGALPLFRPGPRGGPGGRAGLQGYLSALYSLRNMALPPAYEREADVHAVQEQIRDAIGRLEEFYEIGRHSKAYQGGPEGPPLPNPVNYRRDEVQPPGRYAPATIRQVKIADHQVIVGRPLQRGGGTWPRAEVITILHPRSCRRPCAKRRAILSWQSWAGFPPRRATKIQTAEGTPATLVKLGDLQSLVYRSDKWEGKEHPYEHKFKKPLPILASDPEQKQLWIIGGRYEINPEGIVR